VTSLIQITDEIVRCRLCPRLVEHRERVAREKRRAYRDCEYWGKPVPSFGDSTGRLLILGLAPGAHGANRTGRPFTGDRSGEFLYRALFEAGFASQPDSVHREDGLRLTDAYLSSPVRCAPPDNRPTTEEIETCLRYLRAELGLLPRVRVVVPLGRIAHDSYLSLLHAEGLIVRRSAFPFGHGRRHELGQGLPVLLDTYHPSQQNTQTGRLTLAMLADIFLQARELL
jgi:uracil-DNA glycosylase